MGSYHFTSRWRISAPVESVYDTLADVEGYPTWWPQVRSTRRLDDASGEITCRSLLPYELVFVAHRDIEDAERHVLQARLTGDFEGWSRWSVGIEREQTIVGFEQEVEVHRTLVRRAGLFARPALRFNHDLMMREGERGLRRHLQR